MKLQNLKKVIAGKTSGRLSRVGLWSAYTASALVSLSLPMSAEAQPTAPIFVSATLDLNFGTFDAGAGGMVTISPAGVRTQAGSVFLISGAGLESQGSLSISASTGVSVVVSMDAPSFTIDDAGGGAAMAVDNFNINGAGATTTVLMTASTLELPVGARLNVGGAQLEGVYIGTYTVNANYL